ncbi:DUF3343 domain-containing protein [Porphyromonas macacae]|uniref:DUF3343 domain-containing protein n=1 Tax=Porphyromonas macacae TaxID=28115 RepID=UPI0024AE150A|nr:DUF3343 domain-containing protein [Porphyromonas macacae]
MFSTTDRLHCLFPTTREFIRGMKAASGAGLKHRVISVPTRISHECGMCLEFAPELKEELQKLLIQEGISFEIAK